VPGDTTSEGVEVALVSFTEAVARSHQALEDPDVRAAALHVLAALHDRTP
jgi:hypothetical protein